MSLKFNAAAERVVLACLFQGGHDAYCDIADLVSPEMFVADSKNSVYYKCLQHMLKEKDAKADIGTFFSSAKTLGFYDLLNTPEEQVFIRSLINAKTEQSNLLRNAAILVKLKAINDGVKLHHKIADKLKELTGDETLDEILSTSEKPVLDFVTSLGSKSNDTKHIAENADEFLDNKIKNPSTFMGIPTGFYRYDECIGGGLRPGVHLINARPKALRYGSKVYTPEGYKLIEEISVGDVVLHPFAGKTKVTAVYDHKNIDIYRMYFLDGDYVDCCEDHLWEVYQDLKSVKPKLHVKTTKELIPDLKFCSTGYKWSIRLPKPVEFNTIFTLMNPYYSGALIGNRRNEINNFIPNHLKYNHCSYRVLLLRGIMDNGGYLCKDKRKGLTSCKFYTASEKLANDIKEVVQSLGGLCITKKTVRKINVKSSTSYLCDIRINTFNPFQSQEMASQWDAAEKPEIKRNITKIEKIGIDNARCLTLEHNDGLFMTNNFVVTHNTGKTFLADNSCVNVSRLSIPCLNLDTEMDEESHLVRILSRISGVRMIEIETGSFASDGAKFKKVMKAKEELKSIPYYYKSVAGMQPEEILSYMRRWVHKHVGFVDGKKAKDAFIVYDYIKLMDAKAIKHNLSEYQALGFLITNLHNFAVEYKIPILAFNQLNREGIDREDGAANSGSDRLLWLCTSNSIYKRKSAEESTEERGDDNVRYSHKLIVTDTRHGPGLEMGDYINMNANYAFGSVSEGPRRNEILQQNQQLRVAPEDGEISTE